ncbi:MAG: VanZ family protein [Rhodoglobus sp.]
MRARRMILILVAVVYLSSLVVATFTLGLAVSREQWYWSLIAFVPVGLLFLLLLGCRRWWVASGFSLLAALWIEVAQSAWMPEGYASFTDVIWAGIGGLLGVGIAALLTIVRPLASDHD